MKPIKFTFHARDQMAERGTNEADVEQAVRQGLREPARAGKMLCRFNFSYNGTWQGKFYAVKQVAPVIKEVADEIVVVTVYTFFF